MILIIIDNDSNSTVGGSCYSAHEAVSKLGEDHTDMVSCVHRKCHTPAAESSWCIGAH